MILLLAATDPSSTISFAQYGVLGLVVLGFVTGKIVAGYLLDRAEAKVAERDAIIEKMRQSMEDKTVPALIRCTEALVEATDIISKQRRPSPRTSGDR